MGVGQDRARPRNDREIAGHPEVDAQLEVRSDPADDLFPVTVDAHDLVARESPPEVPRAAKDDIRTDDRGGLDRRTAQFRVEVGDDGLDFGQLGHSGRVPSGTCANGRRADRLLPCARRPAPGTPA